MGVGEKPIIILADIELPTRFVGRKPRDVSESDRGYGGEVFGIHLQPWGEVLQVPFPLAPPQLLRALLNSGSPAKQGRHKFAEWRPRHPFAFKSGKRLHHELRNGLPILCHMVHSVTAWNAAMPRLLIKTGFCNPPTNIGEVSL